MGPEIIIPIVLIAVLTPIVFMWAKRKFKDNVAVVDGDAFVAPSDRLTSNALRELESPPWRVIYEIPHDKLNGIGHVLIGPAGVFAIRTTMDPLPHQSETEPEAKDIAEAAIARGGVDDALRKCGMAADRLLAVHWGVNEGADIAVDVLPGLTAVDGRAISTWADGAASEALTQSQVDLAWQTIVTSIGRPDPLA